MIPVILAGGSGSRLWPLSRSSYPKQFLPLTGKDTMLQLTLKRLDGVEGIKPPLVICNDDHRFLVAEQLRELGISGGEIILEPCGRNTAPAITIAALAAQGMDPDALLLVLPADHLIKDVHGFHNALDIARKSALDGALSTFGIVPTAAETAYGYIRANGDGPAHKVQEFVEKPDKETAKKYVNSSEYYWNSGMFVLKAERLLEEMERYAPEVLESCRISIGKAQRDMDFIRLIAEDFASVPSISIDYAVMEKTDTSVVVPLDAGWSDLGSWTALQEVEERDSSGNVVKGDVLAIDTSDSYVRAEQRLVATIGINNCIVVETADAVLVADKSRGQEVKTIVERLQAAKREECAFHRRVHRPWGFYEGVSLAERFQVKRITVKPGASLSLQLHHHRAEHWVVVRGTAEVTIGNDVRLFGEDQSTYIPIGTIHRLVNPGVIPLELIEVQTGSYLGEDDIIRVEDMYHREEHSDVTGNDKFELNAASLFKN